MNRNTNTTEMWISRLILTWYFVLNNSLKVIHLKLLLIKAPAWKMSQCSPVMISNILRNITTIFQTSAFKYEPFNAHPPTIPEAPGVFCKFAESDVSVFARLPSGKQTILAFSGPNGRRSYIGNFGKVFLQNKFYFFLVIRLKWWGSLSFELVKHFFYIHFESLLLNFMVLLSVFWMLFSRCYLWTSYLSRKGKCFSLLAFSHLKFIQRDLFKYNITGRFRFRWQSFSKVVKFFFSVCCLFTLLFLHDWDEYKNRWKNMIFEHYFGEKFLLACQFISEFIIIH